MILQRICKQCGITFYGGPRAYYCPGCRIERKRETDRAHKKRGTSRPLGSIDTCERCGEGYTVTSGLQRYCPKCAKIHALEYDRITGLAYYHANKDAINPKRNERRRKGLKRCCVCSRYFDPRGTRRKACSDECGRKWKNRLWRDWYRRR